jgi:hypothetical protein
MSPFGLMLLACVAHKEAAPTAPAEVPTPVLPSPDARRYALGLTSPRDVLVARFVAEGALPWEESLSGAATTLALDRSPPSLRAARWAAVRAGYPYPVVHVISGRMPAGELPGEMLPALHRSLKPGDHLGLVRARDLKDDRWVALIGRPVARVEPFSRELGLGEPLQLSAEEPGRWLLVSPTGALLEGALPLDQPLSEDGEWWLELRSDAGQPWVGLPVYVAMPTPKGPIFDAGAAPTSPITAVNEAGRLLGELRQAFGLPGLTVEPVLHSLARLPLQEALEGRFRQAAAEQRLRGAGFVGGPVASLSCVAPTVVDCIEGLLQRAEDRSRLLDRGNRVYGGAAEVSTDGLTLVLHLASE